MPAQLVCVYYVCIYIYIYVCVCLCCVCVCVCVRRVEDERESQCARRAAEGALLLLRTTRIGIREGGEKGRWTGWNEKPGTETFRR